MTVAPGARLGPYVVVGPLGAGGMGEVWRAKDTKLGREVALKILPSHVAEDPERRRRFEEEARAASALNHPNIVTVYEIGASEAGLYIAMERVEGRTLREILRGGPLSTKRLLEISWQLADGTAKAHSAGIVHRDLKPENVMVSADGFVKILDFGLAKLRALEDQTLSETPTETRPGQVVGTVAYMSPEQARGATVDFRSDQFALGAILYEAASGTHAFRRGSSADTLAAILREEPAPLARLSPSLPTPLRWTIERCLAKDPDERYASTRDLARDLRDIRDNQSNSGAAVGEPRPHVRFMPFARLLPWAVAAVATVLAVVASRPPAAAPALTPKRFVVAPPGIDAFRYGLGRSLAMLPDGTGFVYMGERQGEWEIHLHTLRDGVSRPIPGTERGIRPFLSPDSKRLGFFRDDELRMLALDGGPAVVVSHVPARGGATWGRDGRIVFSSRDGLWQVPDSGGNPKRLTAVDAGQGETAHVAPQLLPGGKDVLFTILSQSGRLEDALVCALSLTSGTRRNLLRGGADAQYLPSGHLAYVQGSDLMAVPFDVASPRVTGAAFLAQPDVRTNPQYLDGHFDVSSDGMLAYIPSRVVDLQRSLVWVSRSGAVRPLPFPRRAYMHPRLLRGEQELIVEIEDTPHNIWYGDLRSGTLTQVTREGANHRPVVSPDGRFTAFSSDRTAPRSLFLQAIDGSGTPEQLLKAPHPHNVTSWSRNGDWLAYAENHPETGDDIWVLALGGERRARPFLRTAFSERAAAFSPDGHWIAYTSNETGRDEVLVTAFPGPGPRKQVSRGGGNMPLFSHDGRELLYRLGDRVMAVEIATRPSLSLGAPRVAFEVPVPPFSTDNPFFDVTVRGDLIVAVDAEAAAPRVEIVVNWLAELRHRGARAAAE